ncbi:MAG: peptidylprolyl isomerase, partial [Cyanobacteria bacterium P01_E01_bin.35]
NILTDVPMIKFKSVEIETAEIEEHLKRELKLKQICFDILQKKIVAEAASSRNIEVTESEIEAEANQIRCSLRLEKAADTLDWLADNFLDPDSWEIAINQHLLADKLAKALFDDQVEPYFAQNRLNFDRFVLYQLVVPYEKLAQELFYQIEEEEISFYQAAHLYDVDEQRRYVCGYEGKVHRWDYPPDMAAAIFKTPVPIGEVIGPIKSQQGYHLFKIEDYLPAQLTPKLRQEIIEQIFKQWLNSELNYMIHSDRQASE